METLHEFDERIGSFQTDSVPYEPVFALPPSLEEKVAPRSGSLLPFHGDTVAYFLDDRVRDLVGSIASSLHARFGESLSLPPEEFRDALAQLTGRTTGVPVVLAPERLHALRFDSMGDYWAVQH